MDTAEWAKEIIVKPMEDTINSSPTSCSNVVSNNNNNNDSDSKAPSTALERKIRPQKDEAVNCPRCSSSNTKFCYYNNYSLTQPRYFCKACKRYWTEGGSLRNIPMGGASRKNKRPSSSSSFESSAPKRISSHDLVAASQCQHMNTHTPNPNNNNKFLSEQVQYLNLGFPPTQQQHFTTTLSQFIQLPTMESTPISEGQPPNSGRTTTATTPSVDHQLSAMELLRGLTSTRGLTPYLPMSLPDPDTDPNNNDVYSSGYPSLNFSLDGHGHGNGYGNLHAQQGDVQNSGGKMLFPFEDLKQVSSTTNIDEDDGDGDHNNTNINNHDEEEDRDENVESTNGYWSGMLGNAGSW